MMKQPACIFLLCLHFCFSADMYQLFKLPAFYSHLQQHRQQNLNLTLGEYLTMHYTNNAPHTDNDAADDNRLPFKQHEINSTGNNPVFSPPATQSLQIQTPVAQDCRFSGIKYRLHPSGYVNEVWQPPKAV